MLQPIYSTRNYVPTKEATVAKMQIRVEEVTKDIEKLVTTHSPTPVNLQGEDLRAKLTETQINALKQLMRKQQTRAFLLTWDEGSRVPRGAKIFGHTVVWTQHGTVIAKTADGGNEVIGSYDRLVDEPNRQKMLVYVSPNYFPGCGEMDAYLKIPKMVEKWTRHRFLMDSGYYAGRGPTSSDLNSKILEDIYEGLKAEIGQEAASKFARFVSRLTDMSASSFIVAFERFCLNRFEDTPVAQRKEDRMRITGHGVQAEAQAFAAMVPFLCGHAPSEEEILAQSKGIVWEFLRSHQLELT